MPAGFLTEDRHRPDLAAVMVAWPILSEPIRAGILAMVEVASPVESNGTTRPEGTADERHR